MRYQSLISLLVITMHELSLSQTSCPSGLSFVTSPSSSSPHSQFSYTCRPEGPGGLRAQCLVPLTVRDLGPTPSQFSVTTGFNNLSGASDQNFSYFAYPGVLRGLGGQPCTSSALGTQPLSCLYDIFEGVEDSVLRGLEGLTVERCVVAEHLDPGGCGATLCVNVNVRRILPEDSYSVFPQPPLVSLFMASAPRELGVEVSWSFVAPQPHMLQILRFELQYAVPGGGHVTLQTLNLSYPTTTARFRAEDLLGAYNQNVYFRVVGVAGPGEADNYYSMSSVTARVTDNLRPDLQDGGFALSSWDGNILSISRLLFGWGDMGQVKLKESELLATHLSSPVVAGLVGVDIRRGDYFAVVAPPADGDSSSYELLVASAATGAQKSRSKLNWKHSAIWNLQVDDTKGLLYAVSVDEEDVRALTIDSGTANVTSNFTLPFQVRYAVSAIDTRSGHYFLLDTSFDGVRRVNMQSQSFSPATRIQGLDSTHYIQHLSFSPMEDLLLGVVNDYEEQDIWVVKYSFTQNTIKQRIPTTIGNDELQFGSIAVDHASDVLFVLSPQDVLITFNLITGERSSLSLAPEVGRAAHLIDASLLTGKSPVLHGISPSKVHYEESSVITVIGSNFGHLDLSPVASIDEVECTTTVWISDNELHCSFPPFVQGWTGHELDLTVRVLGLSALTPKAIVLSRERWSTFNPSSVFTLIQPTTITIFGDPLLESCENYFCQFSSPAGIVLSSVPISCSDQTIVFDAPIWLFEGHLATLSLFSGSPDLSGDERTSRIYPAVNASRQIEFVQMYATIEPTVASAQGGQLIVVRGLGFRLTGAVYSCILQVNSFSVSVPATINSTLLATCVLPLWQAQGGNVTFKLSSGGQDVLRQSGTANITSAGLDFFIVEYWDTASPASGEFIETLGITIFGNGFDSDSSVAYRCVLNRMTTSNVSMVPLYFPAIYASSQQLSCIIGPSVLPYLPFIANLTLERNGVVMEHFGPVNTYSIIPEPLPPTTTPVPTPEALSVQPREALVGVSSTFTITGEEFDVSGSTLYTCVFQGSGNRTRQSNMVQPFNSSLIICTLDDWNYPSGLVTIEIFSTGIPVTSAANLTVEFFPTWTSHSPTLVSASGGTLYVKGAGFDVNKSGYICVLRLDEEAAINISATAMNVSFLLCEVPVWKFAAGNASLSVLDGMSLVQPLGESAVVLITPVLNLVQPNMTSAIGGSVLTLSGLGFDREHQYELTLHAPPSSNQTLTCNVSSTSKIVCLTTDWMFAEATTQLRLSGGPFVYNPNLELWIYQAIKGMFVPAEVTAATPTSVILEGRGFYPTAFYMFQFNLSFLPLVQIPRAFNNATNVTNETNTHMLVAPEPLLVQGSALDSFSLSFLSPLWQYAGRTVGVTVFYDGKMLPTQQELLLKFNQEVTSVKPTSGLAKGFGITVLGMGFDRTHRYKCSVIGGRNSTSVFAVNSSTILCDIPGWTQGDRRVLVRLYDVSLKQWLPGQNNVTYLAGLSAIQPTKGAATGGDAVTVYGFGLDPTLAHCLLFVSDDGGVESSPPATPVNSTMMMATTPLWNFKGQEVTVQLKICSADFTYDSSIEYRFFHAAVSIMPTFGSAFGAAIKVFGEGFQTGLKLYQCRLSSIHNGLDDSNTTKTIISRLVEPRIMSTTEIECHLPKWSYSAEEPVTLDVLYNGTLLEGFDAGFHYQLVPAWLAAEIPSYVRFDGGVAITVIGVGFDTSKSSYYCQFSHSPNNGSCFFRDENCELATSLDVSLPPELRGPYRADSHERLTCWTPAWLSKHPNAILQVFDGPPEGPTMVEKKVFRPASVNFDGLPLVSNGTGNGPVLGELILKFSGDNFGLSDLTPRGSIGDTACMMTAWSSQTEIICKSPSGTGAGIDLAATISPYRVGGTSQFFTYDGPQFHSLFRANGTLTENFNETAARFMNLPSSGSVFMEFSGRYLEPSIMGRIGDTACQATIWVSSSSTKCSSSSGLGVSKSATVTVILAIATNQGLVSYDAGTIFDHRTKSNIRASAAAEVQVLGYGFSFASYSPSVRMADSAAQVTQWVSESTVSALLRSGSLHSRTAAVTATDSLFVASLSEAWSYDTGTVDKSPPNLPTRPELLTASGFALNYHDITAKFKVGTTVAEVTRWQSSTSLLVKSSTGFGSSRQLVLTAVNVASSWSQTISMDSVQVQSLSRALDAGIRLEGDNFRDSELGIYVPTSMTHWRSTDDSVPEITAGSGWVFCSQNVAQCAQLDSVTTASVLKTTAILQSGSMFSQAPANFQDKDIPGTSLVYTGLNDPLTYSRMPSSSSGTAHWRDFVLEVQLVNFDNDWVGIHFRYRDDSNFYSFEMSNAFGIRRLKKVENGVTTILWFASDTGYDPGKHYMLRVRCLNNLFEVFLDPIESASSDPATWTHVCGLVSIDAGEFTCVYRDEGSVIESGTFGFFEAGGSSAYFMNVRMYREHRVAKHVNFLTFGGTALTVRGTDFGLAPSTLMSRIAHTNCEATEWLSHTHLSCKSTRGTAGASLHLHVTASNHVVSQTNLGSYDLPKLRLTHDAPTCNANNITASANCTLQPVNIRLPGKEVKLQAVALGVLDISVAARVQHSACESSHWMSDTTIKARAGLGIGGSIALGVTSGNLIGSLSRVLSFDSGSVMVNVLNSSKSTNVAGTGSVSISIFGLGLGFNSHTLGMKAAHTAAEGTEWVSDTALQCGAGSGFGLSMRVVVSGGIQTNSATQLLSYSAGTLTRSMNKNLMGGAMLLSGVGVGMGHLDTTIGVRLGISSAESSIWSADSSLLCKPATSQLSTLRLVVTSGNSDASVSESASYSPPAGTSAAKVNSASTGSASLTLYGLGLGLSTYSVMSSSHHSASEATEWNSETTIRCSHASSQFRSGSFAITSGRQIGSTTYMFSVDTAIFFLSSSPAFNLAINQSQVLTLAGSSLGVVDISAGSRLGMSLLESSVWNSDTALLCKVSSGTGASLKLVVTSGQLSGSLSEILSFDVPPVTSVASPNLPAVGGSVTHLAGLFGSQKFGSVGPRLGYTACESTRWNDMTSMHCLGSAGVGAMIRVSLTGGMRTDSALDSVTYDSPTVANLRTALGDAYTAFAVETIASSEPVMLDPEGIHNVLHDGYIDEGSFKVPDLGFDFCIDGVNYRDSIFINSNSYISFGYNCTELCDFVSPLSPPAPAVLIRAGNNDMTHLQYEYVMDLDRDGLRLEFSGSEDPVDPATPGGEEFGWTLTFWSDNRMVLKNPTDVSPTGPGYDIVGSFQNGFGVTYSNFASNMTADTVIEFVLPLCTWQGSSLVRDVSSWGAGSFSGGNSLTVTGLNFGASDHTASILVGNQECEASAWVDDVDILCKVPAVHWFNGTRDCHSQQCDTLFPVSVMVGGQQHVTNLTYEYGCECNSMRCYVSDETRTTCVNVNECNVSTSASHYVPAHSCIENATCLDNPGSFTCACNNGYVDTDLYGETGFFCDPCAPSRYKNSATNNTCILCPGNTDSVAASGLCGCISPGQLGDVGSGCSCDLDTSPLHGYRISGLVCGGQQFEGLYRQTSTFYNGFPVYTRNGHSLRYEELRGWRLVSSAGDTIFEAAPGDAAKAPEEIFANWLEICPAGLTSNMAINVSLQSASSCVAFSGSAASSVGLESSQGELVGFAIDPNLIEDVVNTWIIGDGLSSFGISVDYFNGIYETYRKQMFFNYPYAALLPITNSSSVIVDAESLISPEGLGVILQNTSIDDEAWKLSDFGFDFCIGGFNYRDATWVSSNSFFTFGMKSLEFTGLDESNPPVPTLFVGGADNSAQHIQQDAVTEMLNDGQVHTGVKVRFRGTNFTEEGPGIITWEATFFDDNTIRIVNLHDYFRDGALFKLSDGQGEVLSDFNPLMANSSVWVSVEKQCFPRPDADDWDIISETPSTDVWFQIPFDLGFDFCVAGTNHRNQIFIGSNSYITFGSGSSALDPTLFSIPTLRIGGGVRHRSLRIMAKATEEVGVRGVILRYEGTASANSRSLAANIIWEVTLFEDHSLRVTTAYNQWDGGLLFDLSTATEVVADFVGLSDVTSKIAQLQDCGSLSSLGFTGSDISKYFVAADSFISQSPAWLNQSHSVGDLGFDFCYNGQNVRNKVFINPGSFISFFGSSQNVSGFSTSSPSLTSIFVGSGQYYVANMSSRNVVLGSRNGVELSYQAYLEEPNLPLQENPDVVWIATLWNDNTIEVATKYDNFMENSPFYFSDGTGNMIVNLTELSAGFATIIRLPASCDPASTVPTKVREYHSYKIAGGSSAVSDPFLPDPILPANGDADDGFHRVSLGFPFCVNGFDYSDSIYFSSNSLITFGDGDNVYQDLSASIPAIPTLFIGGADNRIESLEVNLPENDRSPAFGETFTFKGLNHPNETIGDPIRYDVTFYSDNMIRIRNVHGNFANGSLFAFSDGAGNFAHQYQRLEADETLWIEIQPKCTDKRIVFESCSDTTCSNSSTYLNDGVPDNNPKFKFVQYSQLPKQGAISYSLPIDPFAKVSYYVPIQTTFGDGFKIRWEPEI